MLLGRKTPHRKDSFRLREQEIDIFYFISFYNIVKREQKNIKRLIKGEYAYDVFSKKFIDVLYKYGIVMRISTPKHSRTVPTCLTHMILDDMINYDDLREML